MIRTLSDDIECVNVLCAIWIYTRVLCCWFAPKLTPMHRDTKWICLDQIRQYRGSWCSWSMRCRLSGNHGIDSVGQMSGGWGRVLSHWPLGNLNEILWCNFQTDFSDWWLRHVLWNCTNMNDTELYWWSVNICSGNDLVPSGNEPLPEPMLTYISVAVWITRPQRVNWSYNFCVKNG